MRFKNTLLKKLLLVFLVVTLLPLLAASIYILLQTQRQGGLSEVRYGIYALMAFGLLMAVLGAVYLSGKITTPITHFAKSAIEIARGNFDHRVEVESDDEIGRLAKIFNYMTLELKRLREMDLSRIISEKSKTETIIRNIADGVIVTDPEDRILVLNSVAERWFGLSESSVLNRPIYDFIKNERLLSLLEEVRASPDRDGLSAEISLKRPGEWKEMVLQAKAARVNDERGNPIGVVTILRDVTEEREIDRMKTELVYMVAHELRSPLTSISGFSELLLGCNLKEEEAWEYARIVKRESDRLADLVNKFLDISRIEAGKSQVSKIPLRMDQLIEKVIATNRNQVQKKGIKIVTNYPDNLSVISADESMISQVILNLLSNAVKYSPPNTQVEINVIDRENDIMVEVVDHGYGIPEKDLPYIFDKFYRVSAIKQVREVEGSGLGLNLSKQIVELHGGIIWAESRVGEGSVFRFTLPKGLEEIDKGDDI